jgi:peptidoglycan/LPS O-acetylase OafA/YrhL
VPPAANAQGRFAGLDGIRAIAILLVIVWHTVTQTGFPPLAMGLARPLIMCGWTGVDLFFALSGFLITTLILREEERTRERDGIARFSLAKFYARRALRILPAFYVVFLLSVFVLPASSIFRSTVSRTASDGGTGLGFLPYGSFWSNYFLAYGGRITGHPVASAGHAFTVYWSLCVEEHFYLLWPLFLTLVRNRRRRLLVAVGVCLTLPWLRALVYGLGWECLPQNIYYVSHYRLDEILWGSAAAILLRQNTPAPLLRRGLLAAVVAGLVVLALTQHLSIQPAPSILGASLGWTLLALGASLLITEIVSAPATWLARSLELRPLRSLGKVSYGMYLLHFQGIDLGLRLIAGVQLPPTLLNFLGLVLFFVLLVYAAAWCLHQLVERPFLALKERTLSDRARKAPPREPTGPLPKP